MLVALCATTLLVALVGAQQQQSANGTDADCTCIESGTDTPCEEPQQSIVVVGNGSVATYHFIDVDNSKETSHFHLVVPACVSGNVSATDCNGAPLEVAVGQYAGCELDDFPTLLANATVVKIDTNTGDCSASPRRCPIASSAPIIDALWPAPNVGVGPKPGPNG